MLKNVLLYIFSVAVLLSMYLVTDKWVIFILFCVVIFLPILSLIISLPHMISTFRNSFYIYGEKMMEDDDKLKINIIGERKSIFTNMKLSLMLSNKFAKDTKVNKFTVIGSMKTPITKSFDTNAKCGFYNLYVNSCRVYDLLGIFSFKVKIENSFSTLVLPIEESFKDFEDVDTLFLNNENGELDTDYFNFTEYHYGLNARDINWKLSARKNTLIAKKYDTYVEPTRNVYLDLTDKYSENKSILGRFLYLANKLIDKNSYCIVSTKNICMKIDSEETLEKCFYNLFTNSDNREFEEIGTVAFCITGSGEEVKTIE